jgi:hypothetical protein
MITIQALAVEWGVLVEAATVVMSIPDVMKLSQDSIMTVIGEPVILGGNGVDYFYERSDAHHMHRSISRLAL